MNAPEPYGASGQPITDDAVWELFEKCHPEKPWRQPIDVSTFSKTATGLGCRICIARFGLKGENVARLPQTIEEFARHMQEYH